MQSILADEAGEDLPMPQRLGDRPPPEEPNVYSDGSLKNPGVGPHWMIGGIGVWWPGRAKEDLPGTEVEARYTRSQFEEAGCRAWNAFNNLRNSSTRCEIGASLLAMSPPVSANIGVDNQTCVDGTNDIIGHAIQKAEAVLRNPQGAPKLGGTRTKLHQDSISRKPWQLVQNGDIWMKVEKTVKAKIPKTIKLTKKKGHATEEMVKDGTGKKKKTAKETTRRIKQQSMESPRSKAT